MQLSYDQVDKQTANVSNAKSKIEFYYLNTNPI